jgi:hypothetical protein
MRGAAWGISGGVWAWRGVVWIWRWGGLIAGPLFLAMMSAALGFFVGVVFVAGTG